MLKREIVQPGKGGAFTQIEMRDIKTGIKSQGRYRTQEAVERAQLDEKEMQFLYMEGNQEKTTFMDSTRVGFEQTMIDRDVIGEAADFVQEEHMTLHEFRPTL